jgi:acetyl-CoA synthetase
MYKHSIENPDSFWNEQSRLLDWFQPFSKVSSGYVISLLPSLPPFSPHNSHNLNRKFGETKWFIDGKLNASYNCIDRHLKSRGDKLAIIWEGDKPGDVRKITYNELHRQVNKLANVLKSAGIKKGGKRYVREERE